MLQLLASLRFLATESLQSIAGDLLHICSRRLVVLLAKLLKPSQLNINNSSIFPTCNDTPLAKNNFSQIAAFIGVTGTKYAAQVDQILKYTDLGKGIFL